MTAVISGAGDAAFSTLENVGAAKKTHIKSSAVIRKKRFNSLMVHLQKIMLYVKGLTTGVHSQNRFKLCPGFFWKCIPPHQQIRL
ncbi:MAG: hypothetical protein Q7U40_03685, partial [Desulfatirhabdiaceae bacterium]|nr:hypothetical protein [Desulfatirhabdiaceae bacterium]